MYASRTEERSEATWPLRSPTARWARSSASCLPWSASARWRCEAVSASDRKATSLSRCRKMASALSSGAVGERPRCTAASKGTLPLLVASVVFGCCVSALGEKGWGPVPVAEYATPPPEFSPAVALDDGAATVSSDLCGATPP